VSDSHRVVAPGIPGRNLSLFGQVVLLPQT
jgi:hypothetical protein